MSNGEKAKQKIYEAAASEFKKHLNIRPVHKYFYLYRIFLGEFQIARRKGHRINFQWIWSRARKIYREQQNDPHSEIKKHMIVAFIKRHNIRMRMRQSNRKQQKESFHPDQLKWHATTRERIWYVAEMMNRMIKNGEDFDSAAFQHRSKSTFIRCKYEENLPQVRSWTK